MRFGRAFLCGDMMNEKDKQKIINLRKKGKGYLAIANETGLSRDAVRKYCKRHHIEGVAAAAKLNLNERIQQGAVCQCCGKEIQQPLRGRRRKFCSDKCRAAWWAQNYSSHNFGENSMHKIICANCGTEFRSYSNRNRKFCSHECYIESRFGGKNDDRTDRAESNG